jgi:hypothetical protein
VPEKTETVSRPDAVPGARKARRNHRHYPPIEATYIDRLLTTTMSDRALWTAVQMERARANGIALYRTDTGTGERSSAELYSDGYCYRPALASCGEDMLVAWDEATDAGWAIRCARVDRGMRRNGEDVTVYSSDRLCLPPSIACRGEEAWIAFAAEHAGAIRVMVASRVNGGWSQPIPVSPEGIDAFRPCIRPGPGGMVLAWDQYRDARYEVLVARGGAAGFATVASASQEGERWFCPKVLCTDEAAYLVWVVLSEVTDDLGIHDHAAFAMVGSVGKDRIEVLRDETNVEDPRIAADLREGLLCAQTYQAYFGLRRNPMLMLSSDGELWCAWDGRDEAGGGKDGRLVGRRLRADRTWDSPVVLHRGRYGYAVAERFENGRMPVASIDPRGDGEPIVHGELVPVRGEETFEPDAAKQSRWRAGGRPRS